MRGTCYRSATALCALAALFCVTAAAHSICQGAGGRSEDDTATEIKSMRGVIQRNRDGKVDSIVLDTYPSLTDADIERINFAPFTQLASVVIGCTPPYPLSDRAIARLETIPSQLDSLVVFYVQMTDKGATALLERQQSLFHLCLLGTQISNATVEKIGSLHRLETLSLSQTRVTDRGLRYLSKLDRLRMLSLQHTKISDAGLAHLASLKNLACLELDGTKVTDAGIVQLGPLKSLKKLSLKSTKVTNDGERALKALLPKLEVAR